MILSALALLSRQPEPSRDDIISAMNVNICRCGIYSRIVTAVEKAARAMKKGGGR
jgi:aerobic-type carbon monoxide dehydrogenase small subunit (CoxS/CutS family)